MQLLGGWWDGAECRRDVALRPLDGRMELAIAESTASNASTARKVTDVLSVALEHVGGEPAEAPLLRELAVGDRQLLMRQVAVEIGVGTTWASDACAECGERFDLPVDHATLPTKGAGPGFPFTTVDTSRGPVHFRAPTGGDQEAVADGDDEGAVRALIRRCQVDGPAGAAPSDFDEHDVARIEDALEALAPEVTTVAEVACPECGNRNRVFLDPYVCLDAADGALFDEIHQLASSYHWSEEEILSLPRDRRQIYLARIDRARGFVHSAEEAPPATWE